MYRNLQFRDRIENKMIFSYSEFQKKKKSLLEEFENTPAHFLITEKRMDREAEYQKILNSILFQKKNKKLSKKEGKRLQSATPSKDEFRRFEKLNLVQKDQPNCFYLTQASGYCKESYETQQNDIQNLENGLNDELDEDKEKLIWLNVQACEEKFKETNYLTEIKDMENSLRWMKKRNNQLEEELTRSCRKQIKFQKENLQRQSELNNVTARNKNFQQSIGNTERFFAKSLKNIEFTKNSWSKKTALMTDQIIESLLIRDNQKMTLKRQLGEIEFLDENILQTKRKLKDFHNLLKKQSHFKAINSVITFIKENSYGKMKKIHSYMETPEKSRMMTTESIQKISFEKNARDIIRVFKKMKSDLKKVSVNYRLKMEEYEELKAVCKELGNEEQEKPVDNYVKEQETDQETQQKIKRKSLKLFKNCQALMSMQERCEFFIKKEIKCLQKIVENWLKFDQSAINFVSCIMDSFVSERKDSEDRITFPRVKDMLASLFQNWEKYLGFVEQLDQNPLLNRSLSKSKIYSFLRRIIKTKQHNQETPTEDLFELFLKNYFSQKVHDTLKGILHLLKIGVMIFKYSSKYQVLIVNSSVKGDCQVRQSTEGGTNENNLMNAEHDSQIPSCTNIAKKTSRKEKKMLTVLKQRQQQNSPKILQLIQGYQSQIQELNKWKMCLGFD